MKGALRVAGLLLGALRIQKWLLGIGAVLIVAGYLLPEPSFRVLALLGVIFPLVPSLFAGGILLRYFVAPRSVRLIPNARAQILGGMALFAVVVATAGTVAASSYIGATTLPLLWLRIAAATSVLMLSQFALVTSAPGAMLWLVMFVGCVQLILVASVREVLLSIGRDPRLLGSILIATWGLFAFWFLRAPALRGLSDPAARGKRVMRLSATPATAVRAFLFGNPFWLYPVIGSLVGPVFVTLCWGSLFAIMDKTLSLTDAAVKAMGAAIGLAAYAGVNGWIVARRSKALWLRGGLDRMELFRLCEVQAWRAFVAAVLPTLALLAIAWFLKPEVGVSYTVLLTFHLCAGACLLYFGLMRIRGWAVVDVVCGIVLSLVWLMTFATTQIVLETPWLLPVLIAAFVAAALGLRAVAMRRWQRIDWLVCKPPRPPARDELHAA
jgi:hypothetical protein